MTALRSKFYCGGTEIAEALYTGKAGRLHQFAKFRENGTPSFGKFQVIVFRAGTGPIVLDRCQTVSRNDATLELMVMCETEIE